MDIDHLQRTPQHTYQVDADRIKQRLQQEADRRGQASGQRSDSVAISEEGRNALREEMAAFKRERLPEDMGKALSLSTGAYGIMNDFEKLITEQEGTRTDTFDSHVNKMAYAYQVMRERIEEKYAVPDRRQEYYAAEDGSMQELTREKELAMLDQAYETHSRFMAANTQIWSELQDFKARVEYHANGSQAEEPVHNKQSVQIREQAYHTFMSAISEDNLELMKQHQGSLKHLRLDLNISASARAGLNRIWDSMRK